MERAGNSFCFGREYSMLHPSRRRISLAPVTKRGLPQGKLDDGSAMGGAIKYVGNTPDMNRFGVNASARAAVVSEASPNYNGEVAVNVPIMERSLAFRDGFFDRRDGGFIDAAPGEVRISAQSSAPCRNSSPRQQVLYHVRVSEGILAGVPPSELRQSHDFMNFAASTGRGDTASIVRPGHIRCTSAARSRHFQRRGPSLEDSTSNHRA